MLILLIGQVDLLVGKHPGARGLARKCRPRQLAEDVGLLLHERQDIADLGAAGLRRRERAQLRKRLLRGADRRPAPRRDVLELEGGPVERRFDRTEPGGRCRADDIGPGDVLRPRQPVHALLRPRAADPAPRERVKSGGAADGRERGERASLTATAYVSWDRTSTVLGEPGKAAPREADTSSKILFPARSLIVRASTPGSRQRVPPTGRTSTLAVRPRTSIETALCSLGQSGGARLRCTVVVAAVVGGADVSLSEERKHPRLRRRAARRALQR